MTFLEPLILWGLPIALLPVIIHLFNRLRHRSIDWGAMMFLLSATRKSTKYAKLRQWLILLFRVLAVLVLVLAVSRPLAGGWVGWVLHPAPDAIVLVLDRSASMEARMPGGNISKRAETVRLFSEAAKGYQETSRFVLFDTALRAPSEIGDASALPQLSSVAGTDTAADIPATLQAVVEWAGRNRVGSFEIWLGSDLQASNWQPDSERWKVLSSQLAALPQNVRVRLLTLDQPPAGENWSVSVSEVNRRLRSEPPELDVTLQIERNNPARATMPVSIGTDGNRAQVDLELSGQSFRYRHKLVVESATSSGWGKVELPADDSPRDNAAYFVYGPPVQLRTLVVATDPSAGRILQLAAAPVPGDTNRVAEGVAPERIEAMPLSEYALILWQAPAPRDAAARKLKEFMEQGGSVMLFASGEPGHFEGLSFGEAQTAEADKPWPVAQWKRDEGLLANTEENLSLPLNELVVTRRQPLGGEQGVLATFEDRGALFVRRVVGRGELVGCATSPSAEWSNLREGLVLVPAVQRLLQSGGRRFTQASMLNCGQVAPAGEENWVSVEGVKDVRVQAGVYRAGNRLVAVNRPAAETEPETLEPAKARALFGPVKVQLFAEQKQGEGKLQAELWRTFLFVMLLFLVVEAILILPPKPEDVTGPKFQPRGGAA